MKAEPIAPDVSEVQVFELVKPSGWGLNMVVVPLPKGLLVYSPTWMGEGTFEAVAALGEPRVLVAPNHFHHMSLGRFRERFPKAVAVCSTDARPRLERQGHAGLEPLEAAAPHLGDGMRLLACEGTKTGETWLGVPTKAGRALVVCDAFFHVNRPVTGLMGMVSRMLRVVPGFQISRTYTMLGVKNEATYKAHAKAVLVEEDPSFLVPSHGEPLVVKDGTRPRDVASTLIDARILRTGAGHGLAAARVGVFPCGIGHGRRRGGTVVELRAAAARLPHAELSGRALLRLDHAVLPPVDRVARGAAAAGEPMRRRARRRGREAAAAGTTRAAHGRRAALAAERRRSAGAARAHPRDARPARAVARGARAARARAARAGPGDARARDARPARARARRGRSGLSAARRAAARASRRARAEARERIVVGRASASGESAGERERDQGRATHDGRA